LRRLLERASRGSMEASMEAGAMQAVRAGESFPWLVPPGVEALHQLHLIATMLLWMLATCAKVILALLPSLVPLPLLPTFLKRISAAWDEYISVSRIMRKTRTGADPGSLHSRGAVSQSSIERALTQVWS
jgi:hypothetical protein